MYRFDNQNAVITGSTQGLGEATARLFAERGMNGILITGRNAERGNAVAANLLKMGCKAVFVKADLSNGEDCKRILSEAEKTFGSIHILVNSGAITKRGSIYDTSVELWDEMMAVNLRAPFILTQGCIKMMRRDGIAGSIVNVISVVAHGGPGFLTPYSTSKGGLATFTKNVAYSVMRHRIRVNGLMLGWMDTPGEDAIQREFHDAEDGWLEKAEANLPFGRLIKMDEAARAIAWMVSSESGLMTGALIDFDQSVIGAGFPPQPQAGEHGTD